MREILNLNAQWQFAKDQSQAPADLPADWESVNLPHSWNATDGQDGGNDYFRGSCCYMKSIAAEELPQADFYFLEIKGANSSADLYVNGTKLAHHDGGYSTWRCDITQYLTQKSMIVLAVDNAPNDTVYPQMADFTFYGGLYRDVNIIGVSESHFDLDYFGGPGIKVTPVVEGANAQVEVEVFLTNAKMGQYLQYTIFDADGNTVANVATDERKINVTIENVHLWNGRKDPYLYTVEVNLVEDKQILDNVSTRFGCRVCKKAGAE